MWLSQYFGICAKQNDANYDIFEDDIIKSMIWKKSDVFSA